MKDGEVWGSKRKLIGESQKECKKGQENTGKRCPRVEKGPRREGKQGSSEGEGGGCKNTSVLALSSPKIVRTAG